MHTRFSTVAVDTFDLGGVEHKEARLAHELRQEKNWPALVFISSPDRANSIAATLAEGEPFSEVDDFPEWIDENFGPNWELRNIVASGIAVHHGRIPRSMASHFVRLFNTGELPILICTSTLIEGVNTAAKSVLIYDKQIDRKDYDFFTFSNIRGRAGRLGQHHVGSVYLFNAPPAQQTTEVEPPLFGDLDEAPDELVVHISDEHTSPRITERVAGLAEAMQLQASELRLASSVGLEDAMALKEHTEAASRQRRRVHWSGYPHYPDLVAVCEVICKVRRAGEFGVRSGRQLAMYLTKLRMNNTLKAFFRWHSNSYRGEPKERDNVFRFLRACEYGLPQLFSVVELFAKRLDSETNYGLFTAELPRWFRAEVLKNLDEQGVPVQISERFLRPGDTIDRLRSRLIQEAENQSSDHLAPFERRWVIDALAP